MLLAHISIALAGLACTTYLYFRPSSGALRGSYLLLAGTLLSGTYLVASMGSHLLQACMSGLLYTGVVSLGIAMARRKLAVQKARRFRD